MITVELRMYLEKLSDATVIPSTADKMEMAGVRTASP